MWKLAVVALVLAAINQIFSLLDPLIFRHIIDSYATRYREYSSPQLIRGVGLLLAAAVGVALVSRIAKNFQDYFVNVITQKVGARIYTDGVAQQEIDRLNSTTDKILKLELEKVRYLRSLSFVQGSFVNLLRTSILLLMLYLINTQRITVGQFLQSRRRFVEYMVSSLRMTHRTPLSSSRRNHQIPTFYRTSHRERPSIPFPIHGLGSWCREIQRPSL